MTEKTTCAGPCGRALPRTTDNFARRRYDSGRPCRRAHLSPIRRATAAARRRVLEARRVVVCRGPCGKEKPYTESHFRPRGDKKLLPTTCRTCDRARIAEWRASPRGRAMDRDRVRAPTPASRERNRFATARWRARVKVRPGGSAHHNALARLRDALRRGDLVRPAACGRCRAIRRRVVGFLPTGDYPGPVRWLCAPCCYLARHPEVALERREVARDLSGIRASGSPADLLARLTVPPDEWRVIHRAHVRHLEAEAGVLDEAYQAERARCREAFRGTVLGRGAEGRLRRALSGRQ